MKKAASQLMIIVAALLLLTAPLFVLFRWTHQPQLRLRRQQTLPVSESFEMDQLVRQAAKDRFDLTDTLSLIRLLEQADRHDDALELFRGLRSRYPEALAIGMWHAERLQRYGRWEAARAEYQRILDTMTERRVQRERESPRLGRASQRELALITRHVALPDHLFTVSPEVLYRRLAENAMSAGLSLAGEERERWLAEADAHFTRALTLDPAHHTTRGAYANLLLQRGLPGESLQQYQTLLAVDSTNLGWLVSASIAAAADHQFDLGERYIRQALAIEYRPEWRLELARLLSWSGKHEAALAEIDALVVEHPGRSDALRERAEFLLNARRHQDFLAETARLAASHPMDFDLRLNRIQAMIGLGRYPEAVQEAAAVLALDPGRTDAALLKAEAHLWQGDYRSAQEDLQRLQRRFPEDPRIHKRLGQSLLWDRRPADAIGWFRRLSPETLDDPETAQGFAEAVAELRSPSPEDIARIDTMHAALTANNGAFWSASLLAATGRALRRAGRPEQAVALLRGAVGRAETNLRLRLELADLLQDIGRFEEAGQEYRLITTNE